MEHAAIMKKSWGLTDKILSGEKKQKAKEVTEGNQFGVMSAWITVPKISNIKMVTKVK